MTDRISSFLVVLEKDMREDDVERIVTALRQVRGVVGVQPNVANAFNQGIAEMRVKWEIRNKLWKALED